MAKLDYKDLCKIIDLAKQQMLNLSLPLFISRQEIENREVPTLAVLEATLGYLNSKGFLIEQTDLDYTFDYDEPDIGKLEPKEEKKTVI